MTLIFREAMAADLPHLINMLASDSLGKQREIDSGSDQIDPAYLIAFEEINKDPNNKLVVVECDQKLAGILQITFIPYLTYVGSWRCLIEGVRVHEDFRGQGLGTRFFKWAIEQAREKDCKIVQLTSDKRRTDAIRFYEKLGFEATHEGFKLHLR
ncbi:MAG: GNAT superfamily N-acetyltransferase [Cellvibrionaceae bacterium]|jgi:GNAT superfamily N-acetyltransferase